MTDLIHIQEHQRTADQYYDHYLSCVRSGDSQEASKNLWKATHTLISAIASLRGKEVKNIQEAKSFLEEYRAKAMVTGQEIIALNAIYTNSLRGNMEETMFSIEADRMSTLLQKLKRILKDYLLNGVPSENDELELRTGANEEEEINKILDEINSTKEVLGTDKTKNATEPEKETSVPPTTPNATSEENPKPKSQEEGES